MYVGDGEVGGGGGGGRVCMLAIKLGSFLLGKIVAFLAYHLPFVGQGRRPQLHQLPQVCSNGRLRY